MSNSLGIRLNTPAQIQTINASTARYASCVPEFFPTRLFFGE